ncbi:MAG: SinI family restriction endonuclease [Bacteroidota bacterium]
MATKFEIIDFSIPNAIKFAKVFAAEKYTEDLEIVLRNALADQRRIPSVKIRGTNPVTIEEYMNKWVRAYLNGYENRPSVRTGNPSATIPDEIVEIISHIRLPNLSDNEVQNMSLGHSLFMTVENLIGDILEEYLSVKLKPNGWYCAWGSTIDAVDFCQRDGTLLQIKNSDNSENSSSSRVRQGTDIKKWHRRKSTAGLFIWEILVEMTGVLTLSEEDFRSFATDLVRNNPNCIYIPNTPV